MNSIEIPFIRRPFLQVLLSNLLTLLPTVPNAVAADLSGPFGLRRWDQGMAPKLFQSRVRSMSEDSRPISKWLRDGGGIVWGCAFS